MKIGELGLNEMEEDVLREMVSPISIAQVAAILGLTYVTAFGRVQVWEAKGWIKKIKRGRKSVFYLNQDILEID